MVPGYRSGCAHVGWGLLFQAGSLSLCHAELESYPSCFPLLWIIPNGAVCSPQESL